MLISVFCNACEPRWDREEEVRDRLGLVEVAGIRKLIICRYVSLKMAVASAGWISTVIDADEEICGW